MADAREMTPEIRSAVVTALQQAAQGQWPAAIEPLRPLADADNPLATALIAYYLGMSGQPAHGVEYAKKAVRGPIAPGPIAANYIGWASNDPSLRGQAATFFKAALDAGWSVDPIGQAQTFVQQGNADGAIEILEQVTARTLPQVEHDWEQLARDVSDSQQRVDADLNQVTQMRNQATAAMERDAAAIGSERKRIEELVGQTAALVQNVAAENLAGEYADRARAAARRATRWTSATLVVSIGAIAIAAAFVLVGLANHHDVSTVLSKAAISLPLLALAAYLNKLSTDERRDARSWTHIELQIRTARPYLGNLPEGLRDEVQAALALRFFPGQTQDPHGAVLAESDPEDALRLIREILGEVRQGRSPMP
ncbi:MAG: hypothetical protein ACJ77M_10620 [Thermoleophilaceae bacterium]